MKLFISISKNAADYEFAIVHGIRAMKLPSGKAMLTIDPGTIIGYRDGRNCVYLVLPETGMNKEFKVSEDDFDKRIAPKADSVTPARAKKVFEAAGKVKPSPVKVRRGPSRRPGGRPKSEWLAYWRDVNGTYKTKPMGHQGDVTAVVQDLYRKENIFYQVNSIRTEDWPAYKLQLLGKPPKKQPV